MTTYLKTSFALAAALLALFAGINWLVNPYLMFNPPVLPGINELVTECYYKQLLYKPHQLAQIHPRSLILGASRAGVALDPDQLPQPAYNLAVGGATAYINYRLLQQALNGATADTPLDTVILETPFFAFNADDPNNAPGRDIQFEQRLAVKADNHPNRLSVYHVFNDSLSSLLSWESFRASLHMLEKQAKVKSGQRGSFIQRRNGQWIQQYPPNTDTYVLFENSWKKFLYNEWFPEPGHTFALYNKLYDASGHGPLDYYRASLHLLYQRNIPTTVVIAPVHASLLLALREAGLWAQFEQWQAELVRINAEEAAQAGREPFALLDYTGLNSYTTDIIPDPQHNRLHSHWFNDSAHASPEFGNLVLREILSGNPAIGQRMDTTNVETINAERRRALDQYAQQHADIAATIHRLADEAPPGIHYAR